MSHALTPLNVFLEIGGESIPAHTYSESGLSVLPGALPTGAREALRPGSGVPAHLRLAADGCSDSYTVKIRLASRSTTLIEVAFADLPPEARLRLRHATRSMLEPSEVFEDVADPETGDGDKRLANGRRLALAESLAVWDRTVARRTASHFSPARAADGADAGSSSLTLRQPGRLHLTIGLEILLIVVLAMVLVGGV